MSGPGNTSGETYQLKIHFKTSWYSEPLFFNYTKIPINGTFELVNNEGVMIDYDTCDESLLRLKCVDNNTFISLDPDLLHIIKCRDAFYALRNIQGNPIYPE